MVKKIERDQTTLKNGKKFDYNLDIDLDTLSDRMTQQAILAEFPKGKDREMDMDYGDEGDEDVLEGESRISAVIKEDNDENVDIGEGETKSEEDEDEDELGESSGKNSRLTKKIKSEICVTVNKKKGSTTRHVTRKVEYNSLDQAWVQGKVLYVLNEVFDEEDDALVHLIDTHGRRPAHLSVEICRRYPYADIYREKRDEARKNGRSQDDDTPLGEPGGIIVSGTGDERKIIAIFGQRFHGKSFTSFDTPAFRLECFKHGLKSILSFKEIKKIAIPYKIGCHNAGGDWSFYKMAIEDFAASNVEIRVTVYLRTIAHLPYEVQQREIRMIERKCNEILEEENVDPFDNEAAKIALRKVVKRAVLRSRRTLTSRTSSSIRSVSNTSRYPRSTSQRRIVRSVVRDHRGNLKLPSRPSISTRSVTRPKVETHRR